MKNRIKLLLPALLIALSTSLFAQAPPLPPDARGTGVTTNQAPGGGAAPIDGGLSMLLLLGAGYGMKRIYDARKRVSE
jgi:hypothetical protein